MAVREYQADGFMVFSFTTVLQRKVLVYKMSNCDEITSVFQRKTNEIRPKQVLGSGGSSIQIILVKRYQYQSVKLLCSKASIQRLTLVKKDKVAKRASSTIS